MTTRDELETLYHREEDPWRYASDPYELEKYARTLAALPHRRYAAGLEIGCSEGVFTQRAAAHVDRLLGIDISATAIERARVRCSTLPGVSARQVDVLHDDLQQRFDVIFCSEVLYYIPPLHRARVAQKIASWLLPGGDLVLVHTWREYTWQWDDVHGEGGAERLHRLFSHGLGLPIVARDATDDYEILIVRQAAPVYPAWTCRAEMARLTMLAMGPFVGRALRCRVSRVVGAFRRRRSGRANHD